MGRTINTITAAAFAALFATYTAQVSGLYAEEKKPANAAYSTGKAAAANSAKTQATLQQKAPADSPKTAKSIEETIKPDNANLKELKNKLYQKFDRNTIDSIFSDPEFRIEGGVKNNWEGKRAESGEKINIKSYDDYKKALEIEKIFELKEGFMGQFKDALESAEKKYKVDKHYITAIIGIESKFGNNLGRYKAVNALVSTYVFFEKKKSFALEHLNELIRYSKRTNTPLYSFKSSYAGATTPAQFMPWSLNNYYVGEAGDIDKASPHSMRDAIFSAAYYLYKANFSKNRDKALWRYNQDKRYVRAVKEIANFRKDKKTADAGYKQP
jgi:membrane-bound lytic murein transglycosylase B